MPQPLSPRMKPFPWKCGHCRQCAVQPAAFPYTAAVDHDGRTYTVTIPELKAPRCQNCGEIVLDSAANRQISDALRQQLRLLTPEQIRQNRDALRLTQRQLASHLGIAEATLSRWETGGQIQQRALDRLLRLYFASASVRQSLADEGGFGDLGVTIRPGSMAEVERGCGTEAAAEDAARRLLKLLSVCLAAEPGRGLMILHSSSDLSEERLHGVLPGSSAIGRSVIVIPVPTDSLSLDSWKRLLEERLARVLASPGEQDRWFVAPLRTFGPEDAEQASRISRLAKALDALPSTKREPAVQEFQHLLELMK